ncbi:hypothetical protein D3C72_2306470 [compost metagenome]
MRLGNVEQHIGQQARSQDDRNVEGRLAQLNVIFVDAIAQCRQQHRLDDLCDPRDHGSGYAAFHGRGDDGFGRF